MILSHRIYGLVVTVPPTAEPVSLDEVKEYCRVDAGDVTQDTTLMGLVAFARQRCEEICDRALLTQTLKLTLDVWPRDQFIRPPRSPLASVTSVKYFDVN